MQKNRRRVLQTAVAGLAAAGAAQAQTGPTKKVHRMGPPPKEGAETPLFSSAVSYGNLLFLSGVGAHFKGDITEHTNHVLEQIQKVLESAGSSMDKVLKCQVYLNDLKDYDAMNKVFRGRFGPNP